MYLWMYSHYIRFASTMEPPSEKVRQRQRARFSEEDLRTRGEKAMQSVEIRIKGQIDRGWSEWIGGLAISYTEQGDTVLTGQVREQAALYGLLEKLSNVGMQLLSFSFQETVAATPKEGRKM